MKTVALVSALAAVSGLVDATPTKTTQQRPNKRASLPTVTASGNGMSQAPGPGWAALGPG